MRTVTNRAMLTHDHLCSPTNFVGNCFSDFVIIGYELKATIEWRVFLKMTRQVYLVVGLFAFVCLYLNTNMKSHRHSTCLSPRRCGCLRVSVCTSLPVCVCLCLSLSLSVGLSLFVSVSLCVRLFLFVSVSVSVYRSVCRSGCRSVCRSACLSVCRLVCRSVGRSVGPSVCRSVCLSVCRSVCLSVCLRLSRSGACREKVYACLFVCACHPQPTPNHSIRREGAMDDRG